MNIFFITMMAFFTLVVISWTADASWCEIKAETAQYTYENRDVITKEAALSQIEETWLKAKRAGEEVVPWYMVVDVQRVTNDIYREGKKGVFYHNYDNPETLYDLELYQCLVNGY